jgi:lysophospholipase L1-like esterase
MIKKMNASQLKVTFCIVLIFFSFKSPQEKITVFSIGDSTMSNYTTTDNYPLKGWMMMVPPMFSNGVVIKNAARSGRSSKSFRREGRWKLVIDQVRAGDYVFIQFGHNDSAKDTLRHTEPRLDFRQNLINYIDETRAKGGTPVLFTSIARRQFDSAGEIVDTHGDYVQVVRDLAGELDIPLVDLHKKTSEVIQKLGPQKSKILFLYVEPGMYKEAPEGKMDDTHLSEEGARVVAELAMEGIKELRLPLAKFIKYTHQ